MARIRQRGPEAESQERRDRWRRRVIAAQGIYYLLTGIWPLAHFPSFAGAVGLQINAFQAQSFGAVIAVVGATLAEASRKEPPGAYPTALGIAVAGAVALVSLVWLPRTGAGSALWVDLTIEVAFAVALVVLYPRTQPDRSRSTRRR